MKGIERIGGAAAEALLQRVRQMILGFATKLRTL
jgi:hypothetical protein